MPRMRFLRGWRFVPARGRAIPSFSAFWSNGRAPAKLGIADSANEGTISGRQFELRTSYRPGEILEPPGQFGGQHSGESNVNQFYLRSFNLIMGPT